LNKSGLCPIIFRTFLGKLKKDALIALAKHLSLDVITAMKV
jgi:hypothetical protein